MAQKPNTINFYGGVIKRVLIVFPKNGSYVYTNSDDKFVKTSFNSHRNYREFYSKIPVEVQRATSDNLPHITSLKEGDACLLMGAGRYVDKESYEFAKKCFSRNIPVYFIRSNSFDCDPRVENNPIWRVTSLVIKTSRGCDCYNAPQKYFMEIPSITDFIKLSGTTSDFYALFPAMVPMR